MKTKITSKIQPIVLLVFALMLSMPTRGQDGPKFSGGAKILTNMTLSSGTKSALGYGAGAFADYNVLSFLSIRGEALYVSHATGLDSYQQSFSGGTVDYHNRNLRFHTIEIPILVRYSLPVLRSLNLKVYGGGSYSYNFAVYEIQSKTYNLSSSNANEGTYDYQSLGINLTSNFVQSSTSVIGGLAISFESFVVDVRYQQGIPNLVKSNDLNLFSLPSNYKSQILTLSLGYKLF